MRSKKKARRPVSPENQPLKTIAETDPDSPGRAIVLSERMEGASVLPEQIPLLPLRSDVVFPQTVVPLVVNRGSGIRLIDDVLAGEKMLGLVTQLNPDADDPRQGDLFPVVCVGSVLKMLKFPDGSTRIVCAGDAPRPARRDRGHGALPRSGGSSRSTTS